MATGHDGFDACKEAKVIIDEENGPELKTIMSEFFNLAKDPIYRKEFKIYDNDFKGLLEKRFSRDLNVVDQKKKKIVESIRYSNDEHRKSMPAKEFTNICKAISSPIYKHN